MVMIMNRNSAKDLIVDSFKELVKTTDYEKITIKMITDGAGFIRPTFYNHFRDKDEVFEYILETELVSNAISLIDVYMYNEAVKLVFMFIFSDIKLYRRAFKVEGLNSFKNSFTKSVKKIIHYLLNSMGFDHNESYPLLNISTLSTLYSNLITDITVKYIYIDDVDKINVDDLINTINFMESNSILDIISQKKN